MKVYVNCITSGAELRSDIKVLIPEMNLRRRMSRVVKSGVAAGIESLLEFGARAPIDAIITATGLGCIADSEKFLDGLIAGDETMLNPTPFIQSTFNTVGAQIALLRGLHCYNTTYAHRWTSFENALTDAALRIGAGWWDVGRIVGILRADGRAVRLFGRRNHGNPHPGRDSGGGRRISGGRRDGRRREVPRRRNRRKGTRKRTRRGSTRRRSRRKSIRKSDLRKEIRKRERQGKGSYRKPLRKGIRKRKRLRRGIRRGSVRRPGDTGFANRRQAALYSDRRGIPAGGRGERRA